MDHQDPRLVRPLEQVEVRRRRDEEETCVSSVTVFCADLYPESGTMYPSLDALGEDVASVVNPMAPTVSSSSSSSSSFGIVRPLPTGSIRIARAPAQRAEAAILKAAQGGLGRITSTRRVLQDDSLLRTEAAILKAAAGGLGRISSTSAMRGLEQEGQEAAGSRGGSNNQPDPADTATTRIPLVTDQRSNNIIAPPQSSGVGVGGGVNRDNNHGETASSSQRLEDNDDDKTSAMEAQEGPLEQQSQWPLQDAEVAVVMPVSPNLQKEKARDNGRSLGGALLLVLVIGVILVGSLCGSGHCSSTTTTTDYDTASTVAPVSLRVQQIQAQLTNALGIDYFAVATTSHDELHHDASTQRHQALHWLADEDPLQLQPDALNLLQRFLLVMFHYETSQIKPWLACSAAQEEKGDYCYYARGLEAGAQFGNRWLTEYHECEWAGIQCAGFDVEEIRLTANEMNGPLPTELAMLSHLKVLSLWKNEISGTIPTELFGLVTLEELHLQDNMLVGDLPFALFRELGNLTQVVLSQNNLSGTLPASVGLFSGTRLDVSSNRLVGTLPTELFGLSRLNHLILAGNNFVGVLPTDVANLTGLTHLAINRTMVHGTLPTEIGMLESMESLSLHNTDMGGPIPEELFTGASSLESLLLSNCDFSGTISTQIGLLTMLQHVDLADNNFAGSIPAELSDLAKLQHLKVNGNAGLTGSMPAELCTSTHFLSPGASLVADCAPSEQADIAAVKCDCCTNCCNGTSGVCS